MSYETRYAAMVRQRSDNAASTPEAAAARVKLQDALDRAHADRVARYPDPTGDNFDAACEYVRERVTYWRKELNA